MNRLPNIALVGNPPADKLELLNDMLNEEDLADICNIAIYGGNDEPEQESLRKAILDWRDGNVSGIVCLPMAMSPRKALREQLPDEAAGALAVYVNGAIKMTSAKGDVNAGDAEASLTAEELKEKVLQTAKALKRDFMVLNPRVAVLSLNGEIKAEEGSKEVAVIAPVVSELVKEGTQAFGPLPFGSFFEGTDYRAYDAVVEMYDKQCMEAFTQASGDEAFTLMSNISLPITFAKPEAVLAAIYTVIDAGRNRIEYDAPFANPLPKLYHERKEDGDKARFAVKKKGFNPAEHRRENVPYPTMKAAQKSEGNTAAAGEEPAKNRAAEADNTSAPAE